MRWAAKTDTTQTEIVEGLRSYGVQVFVIKQPCDLLCRYYDNRLRRWLWMPLEVKTPYGKKKPRARRRRDQGAQNEFLESTGTPVVTSFLEAAAIFGFVIRIPLTSAGCTSKPVSATISSVAGR